MTSLELRGYTLGEKHRHYNEHLEKITKQSCGSSPQKINQNDSDIDNLLKIDIACRNKDVDYVLDIYKCEDMLYVSRAIKRSTWLIKDNQYKNIINPEFLYTQLFPHMTSKAKCKLLLSIRLNLREESRVENFFDYIKKDNMKTALKWLPYCSTGYIEKVVDEHYDIITPSLLKRLCEKSFIYLDILISKFNWERNLEYDLETTKLLMHTDPKKFIDILLSVKPFFIPQLGARATKTAMKSCPDKISDSFQRFYPYIHLPTFIKYYNHEKLKDFFVAQMEDGHIKKRLNFYIPIFKKYMPIEHRLQIVETFTKVLEPIVDKNTIEIDVDELLSKCAVASNLSLPDPIIRSSYNWYNLLPFEAAFSKIKSIIQTESLGRSRNNLLKILISSAGNNLDYIHSLLLYYRDRHINEAFVYKIVFLNNILLLTNAHKFNKKTWKILNDLFCSIGLYEDSEKNLQNCVDCVLVYNILHDIPVPEIIKTKINTHSIKTYKNKLNETENKIIFNYLYNHLLTKLHKRKITNVDKFKRSVDILESLLNLLKDWNKDLCNYTDLLDKLKGFIQMNKLKSWNCDLSSLYSINKSWKKYMFEESFALYPSDELCVYALKHNPDFLNQHKDEILASIFDNNNKLIYLKRTVEKLRIYWPLSVRSEWAEEFQKQLDTPTVHTFFKEICLLLPSDQLIKILKKYAPVESKIEFNESIDPILTLRKQIAMNMYLARPLLPFETVFWYSKGDYLQYARPSLHAILSNISPIKCTDIISKLIKSNRVSMQKYGIMLATAKLNSDEARPILYNMWKATDNMSVRNLIFKKVHSILIKEKNIEMWQLLNIFIDDLLKLNIGSSTIYNTIKKTNDIPVDMRVKFYVKSYIYLSSLPFDPICTSVLEYLKCQINQTVSLYLLCAKDEELQMQSYNKVFIPFIDNCNLNELTNCMIADLHKYIGINNTIPFKMFEAIQSELKNRLPVDENYILLTKWYLTTAFLKSISDCLQDRTDNKTTAFYTQDNNVQTSLVDIFNHSETKDKWSKICAAMLPVFADICIQYLKQQVQLYSPSIYTLFSTALNSTIETLRFTHRLLLLKKLLANEYTIIYLVVLQMLPKVDEVYESKEDVEIRKLLLTRLHPDQRIYYYEKFKAKKGNK